MAKSSGFKLIANNKKAYFDFFIDDKFLEVYCLC